MRWVSGWSVLNSANTASQLGLVFVFMLEFILEDEFVDGVEYDWGPDIDLKHVID